MIKRLKNHQIDKTKWDEVITESDNPYVYLLSWYLDIISPEWEALIYEDYKNVMPLPVKTKWGIPYLIQPLYCQKIGITGIGVKNTVAGKFYDKTFRSFPYINIQVRDALGLEKKKYLKGRVNYTLDLTPAFSELEKDLSENTRRNIKKASDASLKLSDCTCQEFLTLSETWLLGVNKKQLDTFGQLLTECNRREITRIYKVSDVQGEVLAAACFLEWNFQILYLGGFNTANGKKLSAMFLIMDHILKKYAASGFLLDFEGSNIEGVARFFKGFGGKSSYYYQLKTILGFSF